MHHSFQSLIEVTFNLTLVDEHVFDLTWIGNILQLILTTQLYSKILLCLSMQPYASSLAIEDTPVPTPAQLPPPVASPSVTEIKQSEGETVLSRRGSFIIRGRDTPFPINRRLSLSAHMDSGNDLLLRRYSRPAPVLPVPSNIVQDDMPARGRTMQRMRPPLYRSDSWTLSSSNSSTIAEDGVPQSRRSTLLRVPPFPLPHRALQRPTSEGRLGQKFSPTNNQRQLSAQRVSSIPPPLVLDTLFYDNEDSPSSSPGRDRGFDKADYLFATH